MCEIGNGSYFFSLINQEGSNYPFADDVKNHICLVSPIQWKIIPKCPLRHQDGSHEITIGGRDIMPTIILDVVTVNHTAN